MSGDAISVGMAKALGQIVPTNIVKFREDQNGMEVTKELLLTKMPGGVVANENNQLVGFISEFDLLGVLEAGKDLKQMTAREIMVKEGISIPDSASIQEAVTIMRNNHLLNLPVEHNGEVAYTITRHDLLGAWVGGGSKT
ncbi:MAG: CBS domain-containing protein [Nitrospirales bacterium]